MFTCIPLDYLPTVPQHFVDRALQLVREGTAENAVAYAYTQSGYLARDTTLPDGTVSKTRYNGSYAMGSDWEQWVRENIVDCFVETGVRTSIGKGITLHAPHVDSPPKWKFIYLLEEGGDKIITTLFREKDKPLVRISQPDNIVYATSYDNLVEVDSVRFPLGKWILLNTQIIHDAKNILGDRSMLVATVDPDQVEFTLRKKTV